MSSIHALCTELDTSIVGLLVGEKKALNAVSRVSGYYRGISEPFLYSHISFSASDTCAIQFLFLTLLQRKELATHINSFTLVCSTLNSNYPDPRSAAVADELWKIVGRIQKAIEDFLGHCTAKEFGMRWLSTIAAGYPNYDGALAMILCLAKNIQTIRLHGHRSLPFSIEVLCLSCLAVDRSDSTRPFNKLQDFSYAGDSRTVVSFPIPAHPEMDNIHLENCVLLQKPFLCPTTSEVAASIRSLEIVDVILQPELLEEFIGSGILRTLKRLIIQKNKYGSYLNTIDNYNFPRLGMKLRNNAPELEHFEWIRQALCWDLGVIQPFGSFQTWIKLTTLELDYELLTGSRYHGRDVAFEIIRRPQDLLPPNLKHLHITDVCSGELDKLCRRHVTDEEAYPYALQYVMHLATTFTLKTLSLDVDMEVRDDTGFVLRLELLEFEEPTVKFLPILVDEIFKTGLEITVWRQQGVARDARKLLFAPGYAASQPHWEVIEESRGMDSDEEVDE